MKYSIKDMQTTKQKIINIIESITQRDITINKKTGYGSKHSVRYLKQIIWYMNKLSDIQPCNVFEIGANYGQDAEFLRNIFGLEKKDIYIFEPHQDIINIVKKSYDFNCFNSAVSNKTKKKSIFHAIKLDKNNSGISSLRTHNKNNILDYNDIEIDIIRMDQFISSNNIKNIDFLKVDVEGCGYEVLDGFGKCLSKVKTIQIESEYIEVWGKQKTWRDICNILLKNRFQLVHFELQEDGIQSDSFWIREDLITHKIYCLSNDTWTYI